MSHNINYFATSEKESLRRYERHKRKDPFSKIFPALLSSGQIEAYIATTGMVYPYPSNNKKALTQASLTMTIGPETMRWDEKEKCHYKNELPIGKEIILPPNSITFLRPTERVNLPHYIAARFNLRIVHVHRGLLLGTGPLLDPGFKGYPMIPVHNLTDNEYRVQVGGEFISVEFTKIDINDAGYNEGRDRSNKYPFEYIENSGKTLDFNFPKYINKNVPTGKVKSSLSAVIDEAKRVVKKQEKVVWGSIIGALMALGALIYGGYQLTISATSIINEATSSIEHNKKQGDSIKKLQRTVDTLQEEIDFLKKKSDE